VASAMRAYEKVFFIILFRIAYVPSELAHVRLRQGSRLHSSIDPAPEAFYPTTERTFNANMLKPGF